MKKISVKLIFGFLGLATLASMVGAISGTVAWYAYVTRVTVSYSGTSVNSTKQLQIGIKSDVEVTFPTGTNVSDVEIGEYHYYFMPAGSGLPASVINAYLETKGYTTTILEPVSSYTYTTGEAINLRNSPIANKPDEARTAAEITKYVDIPFAFRVLESDLSTPSYVANKPIFITDAAAQADGEGEINKAIRMFIDRNNGSDFIFNPSSSAATGRTKVSGVLDISGDNYFDFYNEMSSPHYQEECLYGDYDLGTGLTVSDLLVQTPLDAESGYIDINGSGVTGRRTTFTAKHYAGIKYFDDLDALEEAGKYTPHYAEYLGTGTVYPTVNEQGELDNNYAVCVTSNDANRIGEFNCKIYLEGWDFAVIDDELQHQFNLGLTFEIN